MQGVLSFYYKNDLEVRQDSELQKWIQDIHQHGFLSQKDTGELNAAVSHTIFHFLFLLNKEMCLLSNFDRNSTELHYRRGDGEVCHHGRVHVLGAALSCQRRAGNLLSSVWLLAPR